MFENLIAHYNGLLANNDPITLNWQTVLLNLNQRRMAGEFDIGMLWRVGRRWALLHGNVHIREFEEGHEFIVNHNMLPPPPPVPGPPGGEGAVGAQGAQGAPGVPGGNGNVIVVHVPVLGRIARDAQNVHTRAVSDQTNRGLQILLATPVSNRQKTLQDILRYWLDQFDSADMTVFVRVMRDMNAWYNERDCRQAGDWYYKRVLDGLWAYINQRYSPSSSSTETFLLRNEICLRLFEECVDSIDLCCDGHISRLVNVMVGFDAAFLGLQNLGETIQNRMAQIAAMSATYEQKIDEANRVFDELGVANPDRLAWLEAF
jgi:hypothetical protein